MTVDMRPAKPWHAAPPSALECSVGPETVDYRAAWSRVPRPQSSSILSRWMGIADANTPGNVHGGVIMRLCDEVAGIAAVRHSRRRAWSRRRMDRMTFLTPVYVGQLVTVQGDGQRRVADVDGGRACGWRPRTSAPARCVHTSTAYLTMVALDDDGRPHAGAAARAGERGRGRRPREAQLRRSTRLRERKEILEARKGPSA